MSLRSSKFGDARENGKGGEKVSGTIEQQKGNGKIFMDLLVNSMKHLRGNNSNLTQTPSEKRDENTSQSKVILNPYIET